jgi:hypothetical protein
MSSYFHVWPITLPQTPQKGYTEDSGFILIKTPMDAGPGKIRRRGKRPGVLNMSFIMTTDEVGFLESFVEDVIKGTARFGFPHPRTLTTVGVRIVPQGEGILYNMSYLAPGYYTISLQLEVLP